MGIFDILNAICISRSMIMPAKAAPTDQIFILTFQVVYDNIAVLMPEDISSDFKYLSDYVPKSANYKFTHY